jgi:predicted nucleic acid-binding protein
MEARNFGTTGLPPKDARYDQADEVLEACCALWECWQPDALVMRSAIDGHEVVRIPLGSGFAARFGNPYAVIHRVDLHTALLDACVLYPLAMTDALMSLATAGFFAARWTTRIEEEWIRSLEKQRPELTGRLGVRRDSMRDAIPDWEVPETAWTAVTWGIELPDPNDVHVLAAAIAGHADCIVTSNLKDFPTSILMDFGIEAVDPDTFIINQWNLDPVNAIAAFKRMRARRKKPQSSPADFAFALELGGLPTTAERLRFAAELI